MSWIRHKRTIVTSEALDLAVRRLRDPNAVIVKSELLPQVELVETELRKGWAYASSRAVSERLPIPKEAIAKEAQGLALYSITPKQVEQAFAAQGADWVSPFAPGRPLTPYVGYDVQPRTFNYTVGRNLNIEPRDGRIPYEVLRSIVEGYDIAMACIRYLIQDLRSMPLLFEPLDESTEKGINRDIQRAKDFLRKPDGILTWPVWLGKMLWEMFSLDCSTIYKVRDNKGRLQALKVIEGETITPMLNWLGDLMEPPGEAFQQTIMGVPWGGFSRDDLIYTLMWPRPSTPYGFPPIESVLMNANCYSEDTEVLTDRGWLRFDQVDITRDRFATRNPAMQVFEWQEATKFHEADADTMYHATSRSVDMLVTGGHRLLVDHLPLGCPGVRHGDDWLVHAEDLYLYQNALPSGGRAVTSPATSIWDALDLESFELPGASSDFVRMDGEAIAKARGARSVNSVTMKHHISRPSYYRAESGERIRRSTAEAIRKALELDESVIREDPHYFSLTLEGDDFAAFMGMYLAEGSVRVTNSNISIAQEELSKGYVEYRDLLERVLGRDAPYHRGAFTFGHVALANYLRQFGKAHEKYIPDVILNMSRRQLGIFWRFYVLGDGAIYDRSEVVSTVSKRMADQLQEVVQKLGMSAAVRPRKSPVSSAHHQLWVIQTRSVERYRLNVEKVAYNGKVRCVSVPNKTLYVRRNGYAIWCANTDMRMQAFFLQFFTSGAVPELIVTAPENATKDQIEQMQELWDDMMMGNQTKRFGAKIMPHGMQSLPQVLPQFDRNLWESIMRLTVSQYGLQPVNLGLTMDVNRATAGTQMDQQQLTSSAPNIEVIEAMLNSVLQDDLELPVRVRFDDGRAKEDRLKEAQAWQIYVNSGLVSTDEARKKVLGFATDPAEMTPRFIVAGNGVIPLAAIQSAAGQVDPITSSPTATPDPTQFIWPGGQAPPPPGKATPKPEPKAIMPANNKPDLPRVPSKGEFEQATTPGTLPSTPTYNPGSGPQKKVAKSAIVASGLLLYARDTGNALMLKRGAEIDDTEGGKWEFPGGHLEPGEASLAAAIREWEEEVGTFLPKAKVERMLPSGSYELWLLSLPRQSQVNLKIRTVPNDAKSGIPEDKEWISVGEFRRHPNLRRELKKDRPRVIEAWEKLSHVSKEVAQFLEVSDNWYLHRSKPWRSFVFKETGGNWNDDVTAVSQQDVHIRPSALGPKALECERAHAIAVRRALLAMIDAESLRKVINEAKTRLGASTSKDLIDAVANDAASKIKIDLGPIHAEMQAMAMDGAKLGQDEAASYLGTGPEDFLVAGPELMDNLSQVAGPMEWNPGDQLSAALVHNDTVMAPLEECETWGSTIDQTTKTHIADALRYGLEHSASVADIGDGIESDVGSLSRADMIASTEINRYMTRAALLTYQQHHVTEVEFITAFDPCPICAAIAAGNPYPATDAAVDPPIHPRCRCALAPGV